MLSGFVFTLQMLTRIKIGNPTFEEKRFGRGTVYFPVVGAVLGTVLVGIYYLTLGRFPTIVAGALIFATHVVLTGGLHADGLMDSVDALFSGRTRERKLEILKDVHAGAFGVVAIVTLYILKYALITGLLPTGKIGWLLIFPTVARWAMVYMIRVFPYLWPEGLGTLYHKYTRNTEFTIATVILAVVTGVLWSWPGFIALAALTLLIHLWGRWVVRSLGGVTGDIYGATAELFEVATLIALYIIPCHI